MEGDIVLTNVLIRAIDWLFQLASLLIIARVLVSWIFPGRRGNSFTRFVYRTSEPILAPIRHYVRKLMGYKVPVDISPLVAILLLMASRYVLISFLQALMY